MSPLTDTIDALGLTSVWTYLALFVLASLLMLWRLDALLDHGLEGTALGTIVMPYCSGLGNLLFVGIIALRHGSGRDILTNSLVNNVTNLTIVLGLPALLWGLTIAREKNPGAAGGTGRRKGGAAAETERQINRLSLLLTLAAVIFFSGVTWALGADGTLDLSDGLVLTGLFLFWQCFQVFDVLKHNVRQRHSFSAWFYVDVLIVLIGAYGQYVSLNWLVDWLSAARGAFINAAHLGWITGWLMVVPNALLAFYYAARRRGDIAYSSQVGDSHISIPLCVGLGALWKPIHVSPFFQLGLLVLIGAAAIHAICVLTTDGLPRWMGWPLLGAYVWFLFAGLM